MSIYKPTRLYIKRHSVTGLRYFGKSIREDVKIYEGSGTYWNNHTKIHGKEYIVTDWVSDWFYDKEEIKSFALAFSEIFDIIKSDEWANLMKENGLDGGFHLTKESIIKRTNSFSNTINDPSWKATTGKESRRKAAVNISKTMNDPEWKATTGKATTNKRIEIYNDPEWKATIGEQRGKNRSETINDPEWINTTGKKAFEKISKTKNDPEWKDSIGKESFRKRAETMSDPEWIKENHKKCEYCDKTFGPSNYSQWHGNKCKLFK